ncbi:hypothetical protein [Arthrobacter sp. STN4]|uniref:hypothetical protein n=1 Tax=Arthrobacter sp. STN4 TaxID=2923276 RepID=UPI00211A0808|nr:hypothetical protein [Arthrobacter sp. STN4]MCQ9164966.1 hypothetical protein [Arthrobacter sp. STN4]
MEYLVPLVIVLVIVIVVIVASRFMGRKGRAIQDAEGPKPRTAAPSERKPRVTREMAVEAAAKLTPETHRAVYSLIARQQVLNAVQAYRKATGTSLGKSAAAVAALAEYPQPLPEQPADAPLVVEDILQAAPKPAGPTPATPKAADPGQSESGQSGSGQPNSGQPNSGQSKSGKDTTERAEGRAVPAAPSYRYRAIVSRGDEVREVASTRLNEEVFGRIRSLALSGDLDGAARLLRNHADLSEDDAREFVSMIGPER